MVFVRALVKRDDVHVHPSAHPDAPTGIVYGLGRHTGTGPSSDTDTLEEGAHE